MDQDSAVAKFDSSSVDNKKALYQDGYDQGKSDGIASVPVPVEGGQFSQEQLDQAKADVRTEMQSSIDDLKVEIDVDVKAMSDKDAAIALVQGKLDKIRADLEG